MKTEYKGYIIEPEPEPWARKYNRKFRFFIDHEKIRHAETIEEAKDEIDELVNSQS